MDIINSEQCRVMENSQNRQQNGQNRPNSHTGTINCEDCCRSCSCDEIGSSSDSCGRSENGDRAIVEENRIISKSTTATQTPNYKVDNDKSSLL